MGYCGFIRRLAGTADFEAIMDYELGIMDGGKLGVINKTTSTVDYAWALKLSCFIEYV